jgi:hypothetical protein
MPALRRQPLVPPDPLAVDQLAALQREFARDMDGYFDAVIARVNNALEVLGSAKERVADFLFAALFRQAWRDALEPGRGGQQTWARFLELSRGRLLIGRAELSRYVRVGALNRGLKIAAWNDLPWTKKVALLPLVAPDPKLALLRRGIQYAKPPRRSVAEVLEWVQAEVAREGAPGRPRGPTLAVGRAMISIGVKLDDDAIRQRFAARIRALPAAERTEFLQGLADTARRLEALVSEAGEREDG